MKLFTKQGSEFTGTASISENGRPFQTVAVNCDRCHVVNGNRVWLMGIENGRPFSRTGFECWTCGNSGVRKYADERLYTEAELAKINAAAQKRADKRFAAQQAAAAAKAYERVTAEADYRTANADFLSKIATLCVGDGQAFWDRLAADLLSGLRAPTERQTALVEAEVARRAQNASSAFVGVLGVRQRLAITIERIVVLDSPFFGTNFLTLARTGDGDVVTYKGRTNIGNKGETVTVEAMIRDHAVYNGVNQTVIQRPKLV